MTRLGFQAAIASCFLFFLFFLHLQERDALRKLNIHMTHISFWSLGNEDSRDISLLKIGLIVWEEDDRSDKQTLT